MLRWNSGTLLAVIMVLITAMDQRIGSTSMAQSVNGQNQTSIAPSTFNSYSTAATLAALPVSQAHLPPIVQPSELQNIRIPSGYSLQDGRVTHATIFNVQPASDPLTQTAHQQGTFNNLAPQQENPFADPPGSYSSTQDTQDPFADPPENAIPPDQQNPFADPPQDMDPSQSQDPFALPQGQPDVDPFANTPQNIVPPNRFLMPSDTTAEDATDSTAAEVDPDPPVSNRPISNRQNADISGPFKSRGFEPTPIQPAPPSRELEFLNPEFAPRALDTFYPDSHFAQGGDPRLDQPTLVDSAADGFQKGYLYEGMTQSFEDNDFAAYECASCNREPHLPGKHLFGRLRCHLAGQGRLSDSCCGSSCDSCAACPVGNYSNEYYPDECNSCFEQGSFDCCEPMFYFAAFGGYVQLEDTRPFEVLSSTDSTASDAALSFNDGFGIGVAIGQIQGENLRTEIEFAFRDNDASDLMPNLPVLSSTGPDLNGSIESFSGMINFVWDFREHPCFCGVRPYAGGGVGFAIVETTLTSGGNSIVADSYGSDSSFAYQLLAGLSRPLTARLDGFVEYRYFKAESIRLNINVPSTLTGDVEYETDNVFFGLRMHF